MIQTRAWFQLHLSTCIVLMFVAGGLLWLNMPCTIYPYLDTIERWPLRVQGWPYWYIRTPGGFVSKRAGIMWFTPEFDHWKFAINFTVMLIILVAATVGSEWAISRREDRKR